MTHTARQSTDFDKNLGAFIRQRRNRQKLSQVELASAIGVSYQQVQKYVTGVNRLSAERLFNIATVLKTPPRFFFTAAKQSDPTDSIAQSKQTAA